jgi:hypothetical protein
VTRSELMAEFSRGEMTSSGCALYGPGGHRYELKPASDRQTMFRAFYRTSGGSVFPRGIRQWTREEVLALPVRQSK